MSELSGRPPGEAATRDGWHWVDGYPWFWNGAEWWCDNYLAPLVTADMYEGPCLTPAEVAAAVAAEREACAARLDKVAADQTNPASAAFIALQAAVLRRRASGGDALAEHTARVRREALEEAAQACGGASVRYSHPRADLRRRCRSRMTRRARRWRRAMASERKRSHVISIRWTFNRAVSEAEARAALNSLLPRHGLPEYGVFDRNSDCVEVEVTARLTPRQRKEAHDG